MKNGKYPNKDYLKKCNYKRARKLQQENLSKRTAAEEKVKQILDELKVDYKEQYPIYTRNSFILIDFYLPKKKIAIEIDGSSHDSRRKSWQSYNKWREKVINKLSTILKRFQNEDILKNPDNFRQFILENV